MPTAKSSTAEELFDALSGLHIHLDSTKDPEGQWYTQEPLGQYYKERNEKLLAIGKPTPAVRALSDYRLYFSPRGIPLLFCGAPPAKEPALTVENYSKWYDLFLVHPDASVTAVDWEDLNAAARGMANVSAMHDHAFNPAVIGPLLERIGARLYDDVTMEAIFGRWAMDGNRIAEDFEY